ncbi:hypothetical protein B0O99DRAFT_27497 [Bisporella sp. PMI_857]|nr:hypothetical protein B0O99DRAFT_27497 [Bisporella sp. PMI_857]
MHICMNCMSFFLWCFPREQQPDPLSSKHNLVPEPRPGQGEREIRAPLCLNFQDFHPDLFQDLMSERCRRLCALLWICVCLSLISVPMVSFKFHRQMFHASSAQHLTSPRLTLSRIVIIICMIIIHHYSIINF